MSSLATTATAATNFNLHYMSTLNAWFKTLEISLGFGVLTFSQLWKYTCATSIGNFLELTAFCFSSMTGTMMFSFLTSQPSQAFIKSKLYTQFHVMAFLFYFCSSVSVILKGIGVEDNFFGVGAGVIGLMSAVLFAIDALLCIRGKF